MRGVALSVVLAWGTAAAEPTVGVGAGVGYVAAETPAEVREPTALLRLDVGIPMSAGSAARLRASALPLGDAVEGGLSLLVEADVLHFWGVFAAAGVAGSSPRALGATFDAGLFARIPLRGDLALRPELGAGLSERSDLISARVGITVGLELPWPR